ncbi:DNA-directed DNA polymerase [Desulfosarcina ovata subsp. sediminis]|uniref:DNA-directed DNA polymerase n=1 Tax=Desulfosarcina ovata subsp. sediminis TaxID=885957 RepID=A0A5K8A174_9BACT|nr:DNA polymerase III subunit alpha [Desulfosarcina ovata]BBO86292.1 DNA-directed DNA polymerase [Desulfosarcina ovata subsp. sediminis]
MIPLTLRSNYSLMWGTASVQQLCRHAHRLGYDRLALTDTDNLYGLWPFLTACRREGITPIVGAEITDPKSGRRAVCLVADATGYRHLCQLLTQRHLQPDFDLATGLPALAAGMMVLTSNVDLLKHWHAAGVRVVAAMPRSPLPAGHPLRQTAQALGCPLVATPGAFFLHPQDHALHRLLRAIDNNTSLERLNSRDMAPADAWLAGPEDYVRRFAICPEAIANTFVVAEQITFSGPAFGTVMPPWSDRRGRSPEVALREVAYAGARRRYGRDLSEPVVERLEHELGIIQAMNFCSYFLLVRDIVKHSPRTCGRGSGAASLVAYCLGITNVCPVKHNLYFGRFLNPGRQDPPDIDVDFAWDERDALIQGVLDRFGPRAAMVSSHILFQPRMAVRETAKVFGLTDSEIGKVTKRLPGFWRLTSAKADLLADLKQRPEAKALDFVHPWSRILSLAQRLIGIPRYLSVHPGGIVITPDPIDHYVPVQLAAKGVPIVQWEKDAVEDAGLVKIDLLGNRSLGVIRDAIHNVHANGKILEEDRWEPEDDADTQETLAQGHTMGCFYIESPAMRLLQQKAAVGDFEHLVIHSSIIRPAANECIQEYLRRLHGDPWSPIHPLLNDVLEETFGIMVYQEDVSRTAMALAGFSDAEADGLRKVMSKKDRLHRLADYRERFVAGARANGVADDRIEAVWSMMMSFSGYSFCKPHSASYARVSFQAAYLKAHFPAEFMAAVISNQGGFYSTFAYVSEARRLGVTIMPPDVQRSPIRWRGQDSRIRVGLMAVRGLTADTMDRIVVQREKGPFGNLNTFLDRVRPTVDEVRALIHCGALDSLAPGLSRGQLLWQLACRQTDSKTHSDLPTLFDSRPDTLAPPELPPDDELVRLRREFKVLVFLCECHPMVLFASAIDNARTVKAAQLPHYLGRRVRFAGWLITGKVVRTKKGDPMEFLTFEDETGIVETTFFPNAYDRFCHLIDHNRPYLLEGVVEQNWGAVTLTVGRVEALSSHEQALGDSRLPEIIDG